MELLIAAVLANWIGQAAGWWGPWFSSKSSSRAGGAGGTTGPRAGSSLTAGSGGVRRVGSWLGNASGWNDARRDGRQIVDRDDPPVTWGLAWREGLESGKRRGRERFDAGQQRKAERLAERQAQQEWLEQAEERSGQKAGDGAWPGMAPVLRRLERRTTCPECGHGNRLNPSREECRCSVNIEHCPCGTDAAQVELDAEVPDHSRHLDEDQRWGPPGDVDDEQPPAEAAAPSGHAQVDEVTEKRRQREPDEPATSDQTPAPNGDGPEHDPEKEPPMSAPAAPMPSMSGEFVNYDSARSALSTASSKLLSMSDRQTELAQEAAEVVRMCDSMMAGLQAVDSDPEDIGDFMALREQAQQNLDASTKAQTETAEAAAYCGTVTQNLNQRHGAMEEAARNTKHVAKREAYMAS